jgi:uncharacterized protein YkwD
MPVAHAPAVHAHAHRRVDHIDRAIARVLNQARSFSGLPPLRFSRPLAGAARGHCGDLQRHHMLSHNSSSGAPFSWRIRHAAPARSVGETIAAVRGRTTAGIVVRAWLASPEHRAVMLSRGFSRVGVGHARRHGTTIVTADFASSR